MGFTARELCPETLSPAQALPWFALVVRPQHEQVVRDGLTGKGLESFLPLYTSTRLWSDRRKAVTAPLFPGYVFCRFDAPWRTPVLRTPGVRSVVSFGLGAAAISEAEIERVRTLVGCGTEIEPWPYLRIGQRVRVNQGPLAGLDGILTGKRNIWRIVVGIELLQRSVAVQLDRDQVTPVGAN